MRPILFLSDYGLYDEFVGVCHAVIAGIAPEARVIDIGHSITRHDARRGALMLGAAAPYAPPGAVFLAVVDPGVGGPRRAVVVEAGESLLVGPDNGVLSRAWELLGGARRAFAITSERVMLSPVSATFHGRDVFAPAAAHLAAGRPIQEVGGPVDPSSLVRVDLALPEIFEDELRGAVLNVDRFGNVRLSLRLEDLRAAGLDRDDDLVAEIGGRSHRVTRAATFGDVDEGDFVLFTDSAGFLAIARNRASAAEYFGAEEGADVSLTRLYMAVSEDPG